MKSAKVLALAMLFLLSGALPLITVEAANEERRDTDKGYISEKWRAGLGTGIGALNSIKSADIDNDGEDELVFGNSQGFVHILDWDADVALGKLNEVCLEKHTGTNGINKLWPNVDIVVIADMVAIY